MSIDAVNEVKNSEVSGTHRCSRCWAACPTRL